jgi:hypothetical protein
MLRLGIICREWQEDQALVWSAGKGNVVRSFYVLAGALRHCASTIDL